MTTVPTAVDLLPEELAALMHFYAESGVVWLPEDTPIDRFDDLRRLHASRAQEAVRQTEPASASLRAPRPVAAPYVVPPAVAVPDVEAIEAARSASSSAETVEALVAAVEAFSACNLKFSAKHTVFARGDFEAPIMIVGGMPAAEDDREGRPFAGVAGDMLARMLTGAGIDAASVLMVNLIPWRTPGDRAPTVREVDICRPFSQRLIELVRPDAVLALGNLPARILSDQPRASIHAVRGKWFELAAGAVPARGFATFHPLEMLATPACKKHGWLDLLRFRAELHRKLQAGDPKV